MAKSPTTQGDGISNRSPQSVEDSGGANDNVGYARLPELAWGDGVNAASLERLFRWLEGQAAETYDWYIHEKRGKAVVSKILRVAAVVLVTVGGVVPVFALLTDRAIDPEWGYVGLLAGAAVVLLDRSFGFSSSWSRYMATAMEVRHQLTAFQLEWVRHQANFGGRAAHEHVTDALAILASFGETLGTLVGSETAQWAAEFHNELRELHSSLPRTPR